MTETHPSGRPATDLDFSDLRAMFLSCTLKRSPEPSHTEGLIEVSASIMRKHGVEVEVLRDERPLLAAAPRLHDPPQADAGWIGEAGPGPSYLDPGSGGPDNDFTNRNTTFMTWNLMHLARLLKRVGGIPPYGNQRSAWEAGARFDFENPEYR